MTCWSVSGAPSTSASTSRLRMSSSGCARRASLSWWARTAMFIAPSAAAGGGTGLPGSRVRRSSVQRRASSCRAGGMPSRVPTTVVGQERGELVHHVELGTAGERVEQLVRPHAHARLQLRDAAGCEPARDELAHLRVLGRIHLDHRLQGGVGVLDRHAAGRRVRVGVVQRVEHVVEARQRPEVEALVVVHGRVLAQPLVRGVRIAVEPVVERVELHRDLSPRVRPGPRRAWRGRRAGPCRRTRGSAADR